MADLNTLGAAEAARMIRAGEITSEALVRACLARVADRDREVGAWIWLEPEKALMAAREADRVQARGQGTGPLHGVPVGIKDIIETADMPTQDGYKGHEGRWTHRDAACVSQLRDAGAIIMGKTVTTELAARTPGKTRHPLNPAHTPGGSSSGSAAAIRDCQVTLALGTQTGGSVIRPASFCGVHAIKPSFGLIGRTGVTMQAAWLDTVGAYGRSVEDIALAADQMTARDTGDAQAQARSRPPLYAMAMSAPETRPRLAYARTPVWDKADGGAQAAMDLFAASLGADCEEVAFPTWMAEAWRWQRILQTFDNARFYGPLLDRDGDKMSPSLREQIAEGRKMSEADYRMAVAKRADVNAALNEIFARYDAIVCLPATGIAPRQLDWTGDPVFNAFWTYAGSPCVTLPLLEIDGMPLGVQLAGPVGGDGPLLRTARWLEQAVA